MTPRIRIVLLVAATLVVTSCSAANTAAIVNGVGIEDQQVFDIRTAEVGDRAVGEQFRGDLTTLVVLEAELQAAEEDFGITGLDTPEAREAWLLGADESERSVLAGVASNPDLTESAVEIVTTQLMLRDAVSAELIRDEELLLGIWEDRRAGLLEVCASHILVATEAEAQDARERVDAGEDFAAVADELSLDTFSPGGALPCPSIPAAYVEPFASVVATAPVGEVTEPFETEFGWHVVLVESSAAPESFEDFAAEPDRWLPPAVVEAEWAKWRDEAVNRADVVIRSQIGRWFPQGDGILPPPASP